MQIQQWMTWALIVLPVFAAYSPCPLQGPAYPAPHDLLSNSSAVTAAWKSLTSVLESLPNNSSYGQGLDFSSHSFSLGAFSVHDVTVQQVLQYHWTGTLVADSPVGTNEVDENSVYRIASITKLMTTYLALVKVGSAYWDRPVTEFLPELRRSNATVIPSTEIGWQDVTMGALAGQISGVGFDISYFITDFAVEYQLSGQDPTLQGWPPLNLTDPRQYPSCLIFTNANCSESDLLSQAAQRGPVYKPWSSPSYSNLNFMILGAALERIAGRPYADLLASELFEPLGMNSSTVLAPKNLTNAVIPGGDAQNDLFGQDLGIENADEGVYSTLADLNRLGFSILNSTLLDAVETRKWLKPIAHASNVNASVGRPWEIFRVQQPTTKRTNDIYTKTGNFRNYTSFLALSPDHDAGFTILVAGPLSITAIEILEDIVGEAILPALESQAAAEAQQNYAGVYRSTDANLNSSMTITVDPTLGPGLTISHWISNGTDMMSVIANAYYTPELDARLYPTNAANPGHVAFRAVFGNMGGSQPTGIFSSISNCVSWENVDPLAYGQRGLSEFIFDVDDRGRATALSPTAWRISLTRIDT